MRADFDVLAVRTYVTRDTKIVGYVKERDGNFQAGELLQSGSQIDLHVATRFR